MRRIIQAIGFALLLSAGACQQRSEEATAAGVNSTGNVEPAISAAAEPADSAAATDGAAYTYPSASGDELPPGARSGIPTPKADPSVLQSPQDTPPPPPPKK